MSTPCLPAAAICRARLATSCPATSRKSRSHTALSETRGESKGKSAAARIPPRNRRPYWASPSTHRFAVLGAHKRATPLFSAQREGERARHAAHEALERKLPDEQAVLDAGTIDLPRCGQKCNGDGQIKTRASLPQGAWREVDDDFVARHLEPARPKGGPHALTRLLDRSVAHAHDREARKPV